MSRPSSHRPSRIPTDGERFNEELFVDVCDLVDVRGNRYAWLVVIDQHTDNTVFTGGSRQLISTGFGGHTFRVPWRVRRSERVFCAEEHQAVLNETSTLTCVYNSSDNTVVTSSPP